jgi:hypothetical protein
MPTNERIVDHGLAQDICREWVFETARWLMRWHYQWPHAGERALALASFGHSVATVQAAEPVTFQPDDDPAGAPQR